MFKKLLDKISLKIFSFIWCEIPHIDDTPTKSVSAPLAPASQLLTVATNGKSNLLLSILRDGGEWESINLAVEVKLDTEGNVYFKSNGKWIYQVDIVAIAFNRE